MSQTREGQDETELHNGAFKKGTTRAPPQPDSAELEFSLGAWPWERQHHDDDPKGDVAPFSVTIAGIDTSRGELSLGAISTPRHVLRPPSPRQERAL
jgi:hypothetical protein